ncbi:MAG: 3-phosphoshikimate 1-carboxyvinyltransferase, partial [Nitrospinota bacterium]|nr:3-phosphoshikimate 1-carboxyvinyltransferase [Nitrospinota bacterium]
FLCSFAALSRGESIIDGNLRMRQRPLNDLINGLLRLGVKAESLNKNGCPPVKIKGGGIDGGETLMNGDNSSQYFTSLLLSAPYAKKDVLIKVKGQLTSRPYIDLTIDVMKAFGVEVENNSYGSFAVKAGKGYKAREYEIESETLHGDIKFVDILRKMGCEIVKGKDFVEIKGGDLNGIDVNMNEMPDAVQTLAVTALFAHGETRITGVPNLRIKETDRIKALATELSRLGAEVRELDDGLVIMPGKLQSAEVETYDDHRMAMSFALAGLKIHGIKIKGPECVSKSFPGFFDKLESLSF